ncbi:hypothetical protein M7I_0221 [Glarea lozoyensis 74030]|uniref:Uncharacterized protein n=1 Tax=Glarea lozoyensis (strain ATCC 74030 / MF5533) TaxID=1104152 RepID=H0ECS6_GLAL7|nr:hypothetical protein M7I_0221 [Glarea lozoyensis 74030]
MDCRGPVGGPRECVQAYACRERVLHRAWIWGPWSGILVISHIRILRLPRLLHGTHIRICRSCSISARFSWIIWSKVE